MKVPIRGFFCDDTDGEWRSILPRFVLHNNIRNGCIILNKNKSVWIPVAVLNAVGEPFKRGFYCDDDSIRYPFKDNTITNWMLYLFSLGLPILTVL